MAIIIHELLQYGSASFETKVNGCVGGAYFMITFRNVFSNLLHDAL